MDGGSLVQLALTPLFQQPWEIDVYSDEWLDLEANLERILHSFVPQLKLSLGKFITVANGIVFILQFKLVKHWDFCTDTRSTWTCGFQQSNHKIQCNCCRSLHQAISLYSLIWEDDISVMSPQSPQVKIQSQQLDEQARKLTEMSRQLAETEQDRKLAEMEKKRKLISKQHTRNWQKCNKP